MKRTNWLDISYWHYYPDGLSGGILCGLFMPPGRKMKKIYKDDALIMKHRPCFMFRHISIKLDANYYYMPSFEKIFTEKINV